MNLHEATHKYTKNSISMAVMTEKGIRAVSNINHLGGVCDCCRVVNVKDTDTVITVVNTITGELLYKDPDYKGATI